MKQIQNLDVNDVSQKQKRSDNLESKLWSPQFSQKTNEMHSRYYPECISFAFEINWPLITLNDKKLSKSFGGASNINVQKKTCVSTYTLCPKLNWYMIERMCPRALIRIIIQIRKRYTTSLSLWQKNAQCGEIRY
jgi:hypothetical protein